MSGLFTTKIERDAAISNCGKYRWTLSRGWGDPLLPWVNWIMLNPSTADANEDDPTIRRCMGFSRDWGYAGLTVTNLFPFRATDPAELRTAADPMGPNGYDEIIRRVADPIVCPLVVVAWGALKWARAKQAAGEVLAILKEQRITPHCLAVTKEGFPAHPLYQPKHLKPIPYLPNAASTAGQDATEKTKGK